jgi:enhancing lycopene biosynthesis protein 2
MITDGNATGQSTSDPSKKIDADDIYRVVDEGQKTLSKKARVHAIYYITGKEKAEERQLLQRLASRTGGQFREVAAKNRKE